MSDFQKVWVMKALSDENNISWSAAVSYWNLNSYSIYRYIYRLPLDASIPDGTSITSEYWERLDTYDENLTLDLDVGYWILLEGIIDDLEDGQGTSLGGPKMNWKVEFKDFTGNSIYDGEEIRTDNYGFFNIPYNNLNHNGNLFEIYTSCVDSSGFDTLTKEQSIIGENFSAIGIPGTKYSQATALSSILATGLKESEESINIGSYESQKQKFETAFGININTNPYDTTTDVENANKFSSGALQMEILLSGMNNVFNGTSETEENIKIATMKAIANVISESSGKLDFTDENNFLKKIIEKSAENMNIDDATKNNLKDQSIGLSECIKYIKNTVESDVDTEDATATESNDAILEMHKKLKAIKEKFKEESVINNIDKDNLDLKKADYESFFDNYDVPKYNPAPFRLNVKIIYGLYNDANGDKYTGTVNQPDENETEDQFEQSERYTQGSTRPSQYLKDSVDIALDYIHGFLVGYNEKDSYGNDTYASKDANELITIEQADLNSAGAAVPRQESIYVDDDENEIITVSPARIIISNSVVESSSAVIDGNGEWWEDYYINDNKHNMMVMTIIHEILHTLGIGTQYDDFWEDVTPRDNSYYPKLWRGDLSPNRDNYKFSMLEGRDGFYSLEDRNNSEYSQDAQTQSGFGSLQWPDEWYIRTDGSPSWDTVNNTHNGAWDFNDPSGNGSSATLMNEIAGKNRADDRRFYYTGKAGLREYKRLLTPRKPDGTVDKEHKMYWDGGRFAHWDGIIPENNDDVAEFVDDDGVKIGVDAVINDMKNKLNHFDNLVGIPVEDNFGPGSGNLHFEKGLRGESTRMWNSYLDSSGNPNAYMNVDEFKKKVQPVSLNHAIIGRKDILTGSNFPFSGWTAMPDDWKDLSGNNYNDDPDMPIGTVYDSRAVAAGLLHHKNTKTYDGVEPWGLSGLKIYGLDLIDDVKQISAPNPLIHPVIPNDIMCYSTQRYSYITSMILGILEDRGYKIDYESDKYTNTGIHLDYIAETHDGRQTTDVRHDTDSVDGNKTANGDAENASVDWLNDNFYKIDL
tara:strand:- start:9229 stop:12339 length:3111 start_codon:yes stop_codon:yes gene_type:complete